MIIGKVCHSCEKINWKQRQLQKFNLFLINLQGSSSMPLRSAQIPWCCQADTYPTTTSRTSHHQEPIFRHDSSKNATATCGCSHQERVTTLSEAALIYCTVRIMILALFSLDITVFSISNVTGFFFPIRI